MPFISFDDHGVCNYCRTYRKIPTRVKRHCAEVVRPFRRADRGPECVIGISVARQLICIALYKASSCLNAVAYTYDCGMVTDLARRNIRDLCSARVSIFCVG